MSRRHVVAALAFVLAGSLTGACGSPVDLKQALQVTDVSSGWFDAGIQDGKNKLVPSVTFTLKKNADVNLSSVSLNLTFMFTGSQDPIDNVYVQSVPIEGAQTAPITVRTQWGYTADSPQSRAEMLKHSQFRDMEVQIFAKRGSAQWAELQRVKIARQLLTQ